ncbi:uncharacterized protein B0H18DRAFT_1122536 [Fomitopsis serialis]|uniref:uncharacterized protein n=1 Tax=Fomitopsis serialis TaxID=139415 RepID=UPI002007F3BD|nr:uncharacterized protein B0H18DRAFT_1122536 [Neoantrodia serialis]KAH9919420.1 hypothetical protein B0H18DRAFT_1122536 [Neoantrodia serialis]
MHRALAVPELLRMILDHAGGEQPYLPALLAFALTCHAFLEPALDIIWHFQNGLGHLVECLPEEFWEASESAQVPLIIRKPNKHTTPQDWERFDFYGQRVRELQCGPSSSLGHASRAISDDLFFWLVSSRPHCPLLPALRKLLWTENSTDGYFDSAHVFFGQQLSALNIDKCTPNSKYSSDVITPILLHLTQRSPDIRELRICIVDDSMDGTQPGPFPDKAFASLQRLESLTLISEVPLSFNSLADLATLPHLAQLHLAADSNPILSAVPNHTNTSHLTFPSLSELLLQSVSMGSSAEFLSACRFPNLKVASIRSTGASDPATVDRTLQLLCERCSRGVLEEFDVTSGQDADVEEEGAQAVTMESLRRLCDFRRLRSFSLLTEMCIVLDDDAVRELAVSWPRMEYLEFYSTAMHPWGQPTATTLQGLAHFARYCPLLGSLTIDVDTSDADVSLHERPGGGYCNRALRTIDFGQSPLWEALRRWRRSCSRSSRTLRRSTKRTILWSASRGNPCEKLIRFYGSRVTGGNKRVDE